MPNQSDLADTFGENMGKNESHFHLLVDEIFKLLPHQEVSATPSGNILPLHSSDRRGDLVGCERAARAVAITSVDFKPHTLAILGCDVAGQVVEVHPSRLMTAKRTLLSVAVVGF